VQTTADPGSNDVFGNNESLVFAQTFIVGAALTKGSTAFMPPHIEYRLTLALQHQLRRRDGAARPVRRASKGHVRVSTPSSASRKPSSTITCATSPTRYDFDSIRVGIQPLQLDFRGFLFNDQQLAVRLFGNRDNNRLPV
jgi:hypothetical protein